MLIFSKEVLGKSSYKTLKNIQKRKFSNIPNIVVAHTVSGYV